MERVVKISLSLLIVSILAAVIVYAILPYLNYFFGTFILYIIFGPVYHFFVKNVRLKKQFAAVSVIIISVFVVLIPLYFLLNIIIGEIQQLLLNQAFIIASIQSGGQFLTHYLSMLGIPTDVLQAKIQEKAMDVGPQAFNYTGVFILGSIQSLSQRSIDLLALVLIRYYFVLKVFHVFQC